MTTCLFGVWDENTKRESKGEVWKLKNTVEINLQLILPTKQLFKQS